jgi:hypothetical protein
MGMVTASKGNDGPALAGVTGQVSYFTPTDGQDIKVHTGQVRLSGALLANPTGQADDILIAAGQVVITGEVTQVGYRQVIIAGQLAAPAASRDVIEPRATGYPVPGGPWPKRSTTTMIPRRTHEP